MMPIVTSNPLAQTNLESTVSTDPKQNTTAPIVDSKYTPLASLITYTAGYTWTVDYYSQLITKDSTLLWL